MIKSDRLLENWRAAVLDHRSARGIPADDDESGTDTSELWDQTPGTAWKAPEIDLGDGRTLVLEYT